MRKKKIATIDKNGRRVSRLLRGDMRDRASRTERANATVLDPQASELERAFDIVSRMQLTQAVYKQ